MKQEHAERLITEYLKPIYGFALKRCASIQDAEDLSQEIVLKVYRALLVRDDIQSPEQFIWTAAHNALSNYYRAKSARSGQIGLEEISEVLHDGSDIESDLILRESLERMRAEIAYLNAVQRRVVIAYYFDHKRQEDIARELGIPLGTIKWHLFEAKKELRKGMDTMRQASDLKFNPIRFTSYGISGSSGSRDLDEFFRSSLAQNICYCVRNTGKSISEIADALGVSPVYIEDEVDFLEKYGYLLRDNGKIIANILIDTPTPELLVQRDDLYRRAAIILADDLAVRLEESGLLDDPAIICAQSDIPITMTSGNTADPNYLRWALYPYILSESGGTQKEQIPFAKAATIRKDGGYNITYATVMPSEVPEGITLKKDWCGPMRFGFEDAASLWQICTPWSERMPSFNDYGAMAWKTLSLFAQEEEGPLSKEDYAWLTQQGLIKTCGDPDGSFKSAWQMVWLQNTDIRDRLLALGKSLRAAHAEELEALRKPYAEAMLSGLPEHLRNMQAYMLQFLFDSDGEFLLHCLKRLLETGRLREPTRPQRRTLSMLIVSTR